jgi:hypothetical protein
MGADAGVKAAMSGQYSRDAERDADLNGARMMAAAGYDPEVLGSIRPKHTPLIQADSVRSRPLLLNSRPPASSLPSCPPLAQSKRLLDGYQFQCTSP